MPHKDEDQAYRNIIPVILAGGVGRRLWPLSTPARPKPFLQLGARESLLQKTAARFPDMAPPVIICNRRHRDLVTQQLPQAQQIFLEPCGRGTAPALAAAAHYLDHTLNDPLLLVLPSDHALAKPDRLQAAIKTAIPAAAKGALVTFGIRPHSASPHYGYIRRAAKMADDLYAVEEFVEKPDRTTARLYLKDGSYDWNSGIFLFSARAYLAALAALQPDIHSPARDAVTRAARLQNAVILDEKRFSACPALSIDYAVMEQAQNRAVVPLTGDAGWRDLGTWPSLLAALIISR